MRKLPFPNLKTSIVFDSCVAVNPRGDVSRRCLAERPKVLWAASTYKTRGPNALLYRFTSSLEKIGTAKKSDFHTLYKRMRGSDNPRVHYDAIRAIGAGRKCPYCGSGEIGTLDHYLPKAEYPVFAVTPANLIPCCERCNTKKGDPPVRSERELIVHPYFDDFDDGQWLQARINQGTQVSVEYFADPPQQWSQVKQLRIHHHFTELDLATVYITNGAEELSGIRGTLEDVFGVGSAVAVKQHIEREWHSREASHLNSWQTALYKACAESTWYCDGGFRAFQI